MRFSGAKDAVGRLYALAQALMNDYERFEALVDGGEAGVRGEAGDRGRGVGMSEALVPGAATSAGTDRGAAGLTLPQVIVNGNWMRWRGSLEFFAGRIVNERTRAAYGRAAGQFLARCEARGLGLAAVSPLHVAAYIPTHPGSVPTVKQHLAAIRMLCDWLVVSQVLPVTPRPRCGGRSTDPADCVGLVGLRDLQVDHRLDRGGAARRLARGRRIEDGDVDGDVRAGLARLRVELDRRLAVPPAGRRAGLGDQGFRCRELLKYR